MIIILLVKFVESNKLNNNEGMNEKLEVSLEKNNLICRNIEVCNDLNDSIVSIKNLIVNYDDNVNDVYFISVGSYGKVVVVGEKKIFLVLNSYIENYEKSIGIKMIDGINSYIEDIRGFYSEDDKLFVLLSDGNTYLAKDFLKDN